jgi:hypothetical protein
MAIDPLRTARGAFAGAVAAGVWAVQQPLDKRIFGVDYDDAEILGKLVTRGRTWPLVGTVLHMTNGALFGAVYANVAPAAPLPPTLRGPAAGLLEHLASWPLAVLAAPEMSSSPRAFAQSTWRHLVFGVVFGELERRLNRTDEELPPAYEAYVSPNGHGSIEQAAAAGTAGEA